MNAVATSYSTNKLSVVIGERNGCAVEFQLAVVGKRLVGKAADTSVELTEISLAVSVAEREHRVFVLHLHKLDIGIVAHTLGGTIRVVKLGIISFEFLQFRHLYIILIVRYIRLRQHVVLIIATIKKLSELQYFGLNFLIGHSVFCLFTTTPYIYKVRSLCKDRIIY